ncbi:MAG: GntR family transcriptional regulator [Gemmatimonadaceae bacterium]
MNRQQTILQILRERIEHGLATGTLEYGDRLPSARKLAAELEADPRVVLAAYAQLAEEDLVELRPRSGVFVAAKGAYQRDPEAAPNRWILDTLAGAVTRDMTPNVLIERIERTLFSRRVKAAVVECNSDQIFSMAEELETYFGLEVIGVDLDELRGRTVLPAYLNDVNFVVSAMHSEEVERIAKRLGKPFVITKIRPDLIARLLRLLARGAVYFLVSDPRFRDKLRRLAAPLPGSANFHVLVAGPDDLREIPAGAATYIVRRVRSRGSIEQHPGREIPAQRIFSADTVRQILALITKQSEDPQHTPAGATPTERSDSRRPSGRHGGTSGSP